MSTPLIGITTYRTQNRSGYAQLCINEAYVSSVTEAGGTPVLVPLGLSNAVLDDLINRLDGVLFSGGGDILPETYGSQPHPRVDNVDLDRDRVEIYLLQQIMKKKLPFFGICRGLQLINVALGGTLYEDLLDQYPGSLRHQTPETLPRDHLWHSVTIDPASQIHRIMQQTEAQVNSQHHQGIRQLAANLKPSAHSPDGVIEAFELVDYPFGLAVQWHPEWLKKHAEMKALFRSFVHSADRST